MKCKSDQTRNVKLQCVMLQIGQVSDILNYFASNKIIPNVKNDLQNKRKENSDFTFFLLISTSECILRAIRI